MQYTVVKKQFKDESVMKKDEEFDRKVWTCVMKSENGKITMSSEDGDFNYKLGDVVELKLKQTQKSLKDE